MWPEIVPGLAFPKTFGLVIMLGTLLAIWIAARRSVRFGFDKEKVWDFSVAMVLCGILGARIAEVIEQWDYYWGDYASGDVSFFEFLYSLVAIWKGGLLFYGGFILAALVGFRLIYKWGLPFGKFVDLLVPSLALGHSVGRLGCFFQGCCYGTKCDYFWGVVFPEDALVYSDPFIPVGTAIHPTQLYESLGLFLIFVFLSTLLFRVRMHGILLFFYLISYGLLRFVIEFWRADNQSHSFFSYELHFSQYIALIMIFIGVVGILFMRALDKQRNQEHQQI